jgi:hypothetical protein
MGIGFCVCQASVSMKWINHTAGKEKEKMVVVHKQW